MPKCFVHTSRGYTRNGCLIEKDSDYYFYDQNVMCMRSGLVIKTKPVVRQFVSRCPIDGSQRIHGQSGVSGATPQQQQHGDGWTTDANECTTSAASAKVPARSSTTRYRTVDFLSIVTRFYMTQRMKDIDPAILPLDKDYHYWLDIEQYIDEDGRWSMTSVDGSTLTCSTLATSRRTLRGRRRKSMPFYRSPCKDAYRRESRWLHRNTQSQAVQQTSKGNSIGIETNDATLTDDNEASTITVDDDDDDDDEGDNDNDNDDVVVDDEDDDDDDDDDQCQITEVVTDNADPDIMNCDDAEVQYITSTAPDKKSSALPQYVPPDWLCYEPMPNERATMPKSVIMSPIGANSMAYRNTIRHQPSQAFSLPRPFISAMEHRSSNLTVDPSMPVIFSKMTPPDPCSRPVTMLRIVSSADGGSDSNSHQSTLPFGNPIPAAALHPGSSQFHFNAGGIISYATNHQPSRPCILTREAPSTSVVPMTRQPEDASTDPDLITSQIRYFSQKVLPPTQFSQFMASDRRRLLLAAGPTNQSSVTPQRNSTIELVYPSTDARRVENEAHELAFDSGGQQLHRCRICSRVFTMLGAFRSHVMTAHYRPKNQCALCGKHFSRSWLLKGHMRTHTGERPYRCQCCGRAFADKSNLRSHLLIHTAEGKNYVCTRCNRAFAQKRYLHKHRLEVCKY